MVIKNQKLKSYVYEAVYWVEDILVPTLEFA